MRLPRLPDWFPQVRRPFNPAFREVWDEMTVHVRQWSLVFDILVLVAVAAACWWGYHGGEQ